VSPATPRAGDALERLREQRQQIDELFDGLRTHRLPPMPRPASARASPR
jgi:hypothetical protein